MLDICFQHHLVVHTPDFSFFLSTSYFIHVIEFSPLGESGRKEEEDPSTGFVNQTCSADL